MRDEASEHYRYKTLDMGNEETDYSCCIQSKRGKTE